MFSAGQLSIFPPICFNFAERFFHLNKSVCNGIELKNWNTLLMTFKKMVLRALRFAFDFHLFLVFCEKKLKILFDLYILKMIILCNQSKKLNNWRYERNGKCPWTENILCVLLENICICYVNQTMHFVVSMELCRFKTSPFTYAIEEKRFCKCAISHSLSLYSCD